MSNEKVACMVCGALAHSIQLHIRDCHPELTIAEYQEKFPDAPILSALAERKLAEKAAARLEEGVTVEMATGAAVLELRSKGSPFSAPFHETFKLGKVKAALNGKGAPIPITVLGKHDHEDLVPDLEEGYVYDIENLKNVMLGVELNIPTYVWGHKGTGKTTLLEQVAHHTNRPTIRIQHTVNTEESHIVGQWTVKDGHTIFELGPLPLAMIHGWTYLADEYDFGMPSVLSVYQAVLEGKSLVIKEADAANRVIKPHPQFRFVATGNTNGSGDDSGLYQGTNIQNSANFDRFGIVIEVSYMPKKQEEIVLMNQAGLVKEDAEKMVQFASLVREAFDASKISDSISPRTLITAAKLGIKKGSWRSGLQLAFINKMSKLDREIVDGVAQRIFS